MLGREVTEVMQGALRQKAKPWVNSEHNFMNWLAKVHLFTFPANFKLKSSNNEWKKNVSVFEIGEGGGVVIIFLGLKGGPCRKKV